MTFGARLKEYVGGSASGRPGSPLWSEPMPPGRASTQRGERRLRADYLARLEAAGVDLVYVITGRRNASAPLGEEAAAFVTAWMSLPDGPRAVVQRFVAGLSRNVEEGRRGGGSDADRRGAGRRLFPSSDAKELPKAFSTSPRASPDASAQRIRWPQARELSPPASVTEEINSLVRASDIGGRADPSRGSSRSCKDPSRRMRAVSHSPPNQ